MAMVVTDCSMDRWALRNPDVSMPSPRADPPPATDGMGRDSFLLVNDDDEDDDDEVPPPPAIAPTDLPEFHLSAPSALTPDPARSALIIRYVGFTHTFPLVPPPEAEASAAASHGSQFVSRVEIALPSYGTTLRWDGGTAITLLPTWDDDGLGAVAVVAAAGV